MPHRTATLVAATTLGLACVTTGGALAAHANVTTPADATTSSTMTQSAKKPKATTVIRLAPFQADGSLKKGWRTHLVRSADPIDCSYDTGSVSAVNGGTHSCGSTADAAGDCWSSPKYRHQILCLESAWSKTLTRRKAVNVPATTKKPKLPQPLALQLSDGTRWSLRTGGAWGGRADGLVGYYGCESKACSEKETGKFLAVVAKPDSHAVNRSKAAWTVRVGELGSVEKSYPAPKKYTVTKAWFIKNTVKR